MTGVKLIETGCVPEKALISLIWGLGKGAGMKANKEWVTVSLTTKWDEHLTIHGNLNLSGLASVAQHVDSGIMLDVRLIIEMCYFLLFSDFYLEYVHYTARIECNKKYCIAWFYSFSHFVV